jgi:lipopolysaccharide export system permease protein
MDTGGGSEILNAPGSGWISPRRNPTPRSVSDYSLLHLPAPSNIRHGRRDAAFPFPTAVKILSRYVLREHLGPLAFALTALTSLLLLNFIAKRFGDLVGKGLPASVIAEFFLLAIPFTVAMTLPMACLVAVLYAFSRLAAESEITALKASGVGMWRIMGPVLAGATALSVFMIYFNDVVLPAANHKLRILQTDIGRTKPTFALREQVINDVVPGRLFLRALRIDKAKNRMHDVVIYDFGDGTKRRTIVADSGDLKLIEGTGDLTLFLFRGTMTEIPVATPTQLSRISYTTDRIVVRGVASTFSRDSMDNYKSERERGVCEMQEQVLSAEQQMYIEHRTYDALQTRALKALTRGIVDSIARRDTLEQASLGIGRLYCSMTATVAGWFARDTTAKPGGGAPAAPVAAMTPQDSVARAGMAPLLNAPSVGAPTVGAMVVPGGDVMGTPSMVASGLALTLEQTLQRTAIARTAWQQYQVEIHKKFALAVACVVFVLLGAPIALRFPRGGVGLVIGASLAVFALYYVCLIAGESIADDGYVAPWLAMWAANIVFSVVGVILFLRMGREGSTARGGDLDDVKERLLGWIASLRPSARRAAAMPTADA